MARTSPVEAAALRRPVEAALRRSVETALRRSVEAALRRTVEATLRTVCRSARGTVTSGLFVRRRRAYGSATGDLRMSYRSICHAHAAHRLPSCHVLVVRRERFKVCLTAYRTARLLHRGDRRLATIKRHEVVAISARYGGVPRLHLRRTKTPFTSRNDLAVGWPCGYSPVTAVIAYAAVCDEMIVDHGPIRVHVMDDGPIHVRDGRIVIERPASPKAAHEADTEIAETIIDSTVETDARAPVTLVPCIARVCVAPIAWRPIEADDGRNDPDARNPIVSHTNSKPSSRDSTCSSVPAPAAAAAAGIREGQGAARLPLR